MPRVISWGLGGRLKVERMVILNRSTIKLEFDDGSSSDITTEDGDTLEFIHYDAKGNLVSTEPVDTGWAGHA